MSLKFKDNVKKIICIAGAAFISGGALHAQTVIESSVPETKLNVPDKLTIFGQNDPNKRRATAVVNGDIITGTDVKHRLALTLAANGGNVSAEERQRLRLQVLRNLIDETLQIQEAEANEITIAESEINNTFQRVTTQNFKRDPKTIEQYLRDRGSSSATLKRQIKGELAWNRLLNRNIRPFTNVADEEVNGIIERLKASKGTSEYRVGEIYMSAAPEAAQQVNANMSQILEQIRKGGSFVAYARQFSEASTAATGGDLGWVRPAQLPQSLAQALVSMAPGQVVGPVAVPGGFSILYMIDQRQILTADARDARLSLKQLAITFPAGTTEAQAAKQAEQFAKETRAIKGCGNANTVASRIGASVVDNDQVVARNLPAALQSTILALQIGETSPPFGSIAEGIRVLVLCGRDDSNAAQEPNFNAIMRSLEDDRVNKRARTYLRDLRRDAIIEYN